MTPKVRTVTGEISPEQLGTTLMHEHFLFGYPGYAGDVTLGPFRHEEAMQACLFGLIGAGYDEQLMLSHDTITVWLGRPFTPNAVAQELLADWTPTHLFENILPALRRGGVSEDSIQTMLVENPKRLFAGDQ